MRKIAHGLPYVLVAAFVYLTMSGCALAMDHEVQTLTKDGVGTYLADAKGMTLYSFRKDAPGKSACAGPCVDKWPIYFREKVKAGKGLSDGDFGTITREDGKKQSTFRGYPLYYWMGDKAKGDTNGQGVANVWYVIDPANFPPKM
jgi:predicted lipoprotein with Yx(FWY)xxD motif